ncbi:MAG: hypothetical protein PW734_06135 [Verrucomicrobium sp.]|nr:hypothetical protein [Verrucomicrobium sp.]
MKSPLPAPNFAPWTDAAPPAASPADAGGSDALLRAAEELAEAAARLAETAPASSAADGAAAAPVPLSLQITVTDGTGNSLPFTTPDGPDLSLFS